MSPTSSSSVPIVSSKSTPPPPPPPSIDPVAPLLVRASASMCTEYGLCEPIEFSFTSDEWEAMRNQFRLFAQHVRPLVEAKYPGLAVSRISALVGSLFDEFESLLLKEEQQQEQSEVRPKRSKRATARPTRYVEGTSPPPATTDDPPRRTRRSAIKRKRRGEYNDSDEEFEAMLETGESIVPVTPSDSAPPRKKKTKKTRVPRVLPQRLNKPRRPQQLQQEEEESAHQEFCESCGQGGEIMLCDTCPRAFHLVCVDPEADAPPEGDWSCPVCVRDGVQPAPAPPEPVEEDDPHMSSCRVCKEGGELLCCDFCHNSYHMDCMIPPVIDVPEEEWACVQCSMPAPKVPVKKILTWRWSEDEIPGRSIEAISRGSRKHRELFVKYDGLSYWHCDWIADCMLEFHQQTLWRCYWRKAASLEIPPSPATLDDEAFDPADDLTQRYYRNGVKPEWLSVHRIINHNRERGCCFFLVKWRDLSYDQATYEPETGDYATQIINWQQHIDLYWKNRSRMVDENRAAKRRRRNISLSQTTSALITKKYEQQPDYIDEVGGTLHEYQLEGLNWLRYSWSQGTDVILADEMGLGKTVQTISFLYSLFKEDLCSGPFLISAPLSTIINWDREFEFWAPDMYVVTYTGDRESRSMIRKHEFCVEDDAIRAGAKASRVRSGSVVKFQVLLTSYELVSVDSACLSSVDWEILVVDEAHRLKNNQSRFFKTLREFQIKRKVLLTGTPLQNNLEELYHLLNFLSPDNFNDMVGFLQEFSDISKDNQVKKLHDMLGPHLLRRLKADVLKNMPSKSEFIVRIEPSPLQKKYYQHIIHKNYEVLSAKGGGAQTSLLNIVMELKKCCNHPYLLAAAAEEAPVNAQGQYEGRSLIRACGKLELLAKMLPRLKETGHRVLIFSQMTRMMDLLEDFFDYMGYRYERIDGKITGQERQDAIDRFNARNADQFVFILSTRSGGLGINLATADTVVIYDSDWNPHNDIQAFSRAHRLGQQNKVMIYRFVTRETVEERICQVAKRKMMLTHLIVRPGVGKAGQNMSKKELEDIVRFGTQSLFKGDGGEKEEAGGEEASGVMIHYDDAAIDALLDRSQQGIEEKECGLNEYLSSFKVASYQTMTAAASAGTTKLDDADMETMETSETAGGDDAGAESYWERLLGEQHAQLVEDETKNLGKGKRSRRNVNYAVPGYDEIEMGGGSGDGGSDMSTFAADVNDAEDEDADFDERAPDSRKRKSTAAAAATNRNDHQRSTPPLLVRSAHSQGGVEVLGFSARQRKAFLNALMRYGLGPFDTKRINQQWLVRDLRQKSEKEIHTYARMFLAHLLEKENSSDPDHFNDGVPRENVSRSQVFCRLATMLLVRRKVNEFEQFNGVWSMPESAPKTSDPATHHTATNLSPINYRFNVIDGGYSELYTCWASELAQINGKVECIQDEGRRDEILAISQRVIWNPIHDYWLLVGVNTHGFSRWQDILNDARFSILNAGLQTVFEDPERTTDAKHRFIARRFKLIESALLMEEQLRRAYVYGADFQPTGCDLQPIQQPTLHYNYIDALTRTCIPFAQSLARCSEGDDLRRKMRTYSTSMLIKLIHKLDENLNALKTDMNRLPSVANSYHSANCKIIANAVVRDIEKGLQTRQSEIHARGAFSIIQPEVITQNIGDFVIINNNSSSNARDNDDEGENHQQQDEEEDDDVVFLG